MDTLGNSFSMLKNPAILKFIMQGVLFTMIISVAAVLFSIVIGTGLALLRNYCTNKKTGILKVLSVIYIELFRNTPSVNNKLLFKATVALILYTSGVIAEIVRGGLNSVASGQVEAGYSQGFSMLQILWYIVLPQTFRSIIPTLLSQVITTIKDSSFLANVAVIELMARTKQVLSSANRYNGLNAINVSDVFVLFGVAAAMYFVINFSISMTVRNMQKARKMRRLLPQEFCKDMAGVFDNRDICIDSSKFGAEATAKILCGIARSVFK